jgi:3-phosphoshikimate 1-carboxyvinyltransferase
MHERPIGDLVDALNAVGAQIEYTGKPGYPPLRIRRGHIHASRMSVRGNVSSQFLTALLMAAPLMAQRAPVTIDVVGELISKPYIEITLNLMRRFGVTVEQDGWASFTVQPGQRYRSRAASTSRATPRRPPTSWRPARLPAGRCGSRAWAATASRATCALPTRWSRWARSSRAATTGSRRARTACLKAIDADFNHIPDAAMTIAVAALYADGTSTLRNIASWRVKETDRLAAMATELRKVGATVEEGADYLRVTPPEATAAGHHRHLRRPPDGDVLLAGLAGRQGAARQRDAHQRSEVRGQDFPGLFRNVCRDRQRRTILNATG